MLNTYNSSSQTAAVDQVLVYDTDSYNQGTAISHMPGSGVITLNSPGVYQVSFNAVASPSEDSTGTNSAITAQLYKNGTAVTNALSTGTVQATTDIVSLGFNILVEGPMNCMCGCPCGSRVVSLTVQNVDVEAEYSLANITVVKVR